MSHKPTYPNIAIGGSSVYAYGITERSHGRLPGKEECSTSDIRYRAMLFSGYADFTRFSTENFSEQSEMTKDDYVIICGDFGGVWDKDEESSREKWWMDWLEDKTVTTLFVDGNHENFDRLYAYPVEEWNGGKKIFTFGGAKSHDISGGILELDDPDFYDKRNALEEDWIPYRINHIYLRRMGKRDL